MNNMGDKTAPCLTPLFNGKDDEHCELDWIGSGSSISVARSYSLYQCYRREIGVCGTQPSQRTSPVHRMLGKQCHR